MQLWTPLRYAAWHLEECSLIKKIQSSHKDPEHNTRLRKPSFWIFRTKVFYYLQKFGKKVVYSLTFLVYNNYIDRHWNLNRSDDRKKKIEKFVLQVHGFGLE